MTLPREFDINVRPAGDGVSWSASALHPSCFYLAIEYGATRAEAVARLAVALDKLERNGQDEIESNPDDVGDFVVSDLGEAEA